MVFDYTGDVCVCKNGVGQTGAGCLVIGAEKCASCDALQVYNQSRENQVYSSVLDCALFVGGHNGLSLATCVRKHSE